MVYSPRLWLMAIGWWNKINQCQKLKLNPTQTWGVCMSLDSGMHWSQISDIVMTSQERNKCRARRSKRTQVLKHSFRKVSVSHAQLAHFSTLAKEKHMLLILNFSTLTFITNARTTMRVTRVTRMAYSPRLWLMAIGWWNKINQCQKLKLNLTQTWGVCMSLDSGMHWSQNQWYCDDKPRKE